MLKYIRSLPLWSAKFVQRDCGSILKRTDELDLSLRTSKWSFTRANVRSFHVTGSIPAAAKQRNLYSILQVSPNATQEEIKRAYYKLSFQFHPDRNKGKTSTVEKFQEISDAYSVLGDAEERTKYDRQFITSTDRPVGARASSARNAKIIYNFDEWHKKHYEEARLRRQRSIHESRMYAKESFVQQQENEITDQSRVFWTVFSVVLVLIVFVYIVEKRREEREFEETINPESRRRPKE